MIRRLLAIILLIPLSAAMADTWYCDPVNGSTPKNPSDASKGNGSAAKPWGTLSSVFMAKLINGADASKAKVHAGDTIKLRTGDHGVVVMTGSEYLSTEPITVIAEDGHEPVITRLVAGSQIRNWLFQGMTFQSLPNVVAYQKIVQLQGEAITVHRCKFRPSGDPTQMTDAELTANCPHYGLYVTASKNVRVTECEFFGLENGMHFEVNGLVCDGNTVEYRLNDGITHAADNAVISNNRIVDQRNVAANKYHHDGIQGWTLPAKGSTPASGGKNVVIKGNYITYSTGRYKEIPAISPMTNYDEYAMQGIVCFSGPWDGLVIEDNIVMAVSCNGITVYDAINTVIRNNTLIDQGRIGTWINIDKGPKPESNLIANNIARYYLCQQGTRMSNNFAFVRGWQSWAQSPVIVDPKKTFKLYDLENARFDLSVLPDSPAAGKEVITVTRTPAAGAVK